MSLSYLGPHRMPTLASVHSSQGTISMEMRPLQQGTLQGMSTDRQSPNDLLLDHSRLHLLLCPWEKPLHQVLQALAGSKQASKSDGKRCAPLLQQAAATDAQILTACPTSDGHYCVIKCSDDAGSQQPLDCQLIDCMPVTTSCVMHLPTPPYSCRQSASYQTVDLKSSAELTTPSILPPVNSLYCSWLTISLGRVISKKSCFCEHCQLSLCTMQC